MPMGIFDSKPLKIPARKLLGLATEVHERGRIGFAQQLRAQARKYLRECAAMGTDCNDRTNSAEDTTECSIKGFQEPVTLLRTEASGYTTPAQPLETEL